MNTCETNIYLNLENIAFKTQIPPKLLYNYFYSYNLQEVFMFLIPGFIPFLGLFVIPLVSYFLIKRYKYKLSNLQIIIVFLLIWSLNATLICLTFLSGYDFITSLYSFLCNIKVIHAEYIEGINQAVRTFNHFGLEDESIVDTLKIFRSIANGILEYITLHIDIQVVSKYYSLLFISFHCLTLFIITTTFSFAFRNKSLIYISIVTFITLAWLLSSSMFLLSYVFSSLNTFLEDFYKTPSEYFGKNICEFSDLKLCDSISYCNKNKNSNILSNIIDNYSSEINNTVVLDDLKTKLDDIQFLSCSTLSDLTEKANLKIVTNASFLFFIFTLCFTSTTFLFFPLLTPINIEVGTFTSV